MKNTPEFWSRFKKALETPGFAEKAKDIMGTEAFEVSVKILAADHMIKEAIISNNPQVTQDNLVKVSHLHEEIETDLTILQK